MASSKLGACAHKLARKARQRTCMLQPRAARRHCTPPTLVKLWSCALFRARCCRRLSHRGATGRLASDTPERRRHAKRRHLRTAFDLQRRFSPLAAAGHGPFGMAAIVGAVAALLQCDCRLVAAFLQCDCRLVAALFKCDCRLVAVRSKHGSSSIMARFKHDLSTIEIRSKYDRLASHRRRRLYIGLDTHCAG